MKILLASYAYAPSVGGIESSSKVLAEEWRRLGHEVTVVTESAGAHEAGVLRCPTWSALRAAVRKCDLFFQNNPSLRLARSWPLSPRPWVVTLQTWLRHPEWPLTLSVRLKRLSLRAAHCVAISRAVAKDIGGKVDVIPNPYDDRVFHAQGRQAVSGSLAFVGRLVSDKGVDLVIEALALLRQQGASKKLMIIGDGPERAELQKRVQQRALADCVEWCGALPPQEIAQRLRTVEALVVPSRWPEPFGIVAVEGAACGCIVIGSDQGGLPEAIGPTGWTFRSGDAHSLASAIRKLDADPDSVAAARSAAPAHLQSHTGSAVAARYLECFHRVLEASRGERAAG